MTKPSGEHDVFFRFILKLSFMMFCSVMLVSDFSGHADSDMSYRVSGRNSLSWGEMLALVRTCSKIESPVKEIKETVKRGDTIIDILSRAGLEYKSAHTLFLDIKPVYDLRRIRVGQKYTVALKNGQVRYFCYEVDNEQRLKVVRDQDNRFSGKIEPIVFTVRRKIISGTVSDSLFLTVLDLGEGPELADRLAGLYEYDIDFNRDVQKGDSFSLLFEKKYRNGVFARYGPILAAEFRNQSRLIRIVRYTDPRGKTDYYHPDGAAVKKMFLRCPLPFMRISSGYGTRRHPVLGFSARHHGIDLAAPPGTRVRATASGIITRLAFDRIKGRYIIIRHPNRYDTHYYHLNGVKKGIRQGGSVSQGEVIGFVGRSGRTTGYHLHYGIKKNGRFINPLSLKSPSKNPVKKIYVPEFEKYCSALFFLLSGKHFLSIPDKIREILFDRVGTSLDSAGDGIIH